MREYSKILIAFVLLLGLTLTGCQASTDAVSERVEILNHMRLPRNKDPEYRKYAADFLAHKGEKASMAYPNGMPMMLL